MITCIRSTANRPVDSGIFQPIGHARTEQQVVDTESGVPGPAVSLVIPERVDALIRMCRSDGVCPTLGEQLPKCRPWRGLKQSIPIPRFGRIDILIRRHDVIVACQDDRNL